ncbi:hypothetical protein F5Y12DRAFT_502835 [Xylaria sp. FL1777]|nr:hypothetical protein F5Y12DRAFT_502835 [Xylaria sp. FL1777]
MEDDSNSNLPEQQQGRPCVPTDSLYDGPLDHIIRNHPELFVRPLYWTNRHARVLHVACKEEQVLFRLPKKQHRRPIQEHINEDSIQEPAKMRTESNMLHVTRFQSSRISNPDLEAHIGGPRAHGTHDTSDALAFTAIAGLRAEETSEPINASMTTLNHNQPLKHWDYKSGKNSNRKHRRLKVKRASIDLIYGGRKITIVPTSRTYTLVGDTRYTWRHAWRLICLDRSQLEIKRLSRRKRALLTGINRADMAKNDDSNWTFNAGRMASLFIAMAQQRQNKTEYEDKAQRAQHSAADKQEPSHVPSQLQPRYQIVLTDNRRNNPYIHLYTAHVSDFLLAHFRTPAHLPKIARADDNSPLMKIHRVTIPSTPRKSFQRRLRTAITQYANGTAGGFFSDLSPRDDGEQEHDDESVAVKVEPVSTARYPCQSPF